MKPIENGNNLDSVQEIGLKENKRGGVLWLYVSLSLEGIGVI